MSILLYFLDGKCLDQSQIDSDVLAIGENDILNKLNEAVNDSTNQIDIETMLGTFKYHIIKKPERIGFFLKKIGCFNVKGLKSK